MYVKVPSPVPETSFQTAYGLGAFFATLFGPIAGALIAFIGHALSDAIQYGSPWWSWVIASGVAGFIFGFAFKRTKVEEGEFKGKDILTFNVIQVIGNVIAWIVVAPVLDILIYQEPVNSGLHPGHYRRDHEFHQRWCDRHPVAGRLCSHPHKEGQPQQEARGMLCSMLAIKLRLFRSVEVCSFMYSIDCDILWINSHYRISGFFISIFQSG